MSHTKYDRETAVLRHLVNELKGEWEFRQGNGRGIGGKAALYRCWQADWVEIAPHGPEVLGQHWRITDEGRGELFRRTGVAS